MYWVHCNNCYFLPVQGKQFFLTSCGHIYCADCKPFCTEGTCKLCTNPCNTIPLSAQMKPDVEMYFTDPMTLLKKYLTKIDQVAEFQDSHRARLMTYQKSQVEKIRVLKDEYKKVIKKYKDCEMERQKYKKELQRFQQMAYSESNSPNMNYDGNFMFVTPTTQNVPGSAHSSIASKVQSTNQKNMSFLKSLFSPTDNTNLVSRVGRISVTAPPKNGRMGTISGVSPAMESPPNPGSMRSHQIPSRMSSRPVLGLISNHTPYSTCSEGSESAMHESPSYYTPESNLSGGHFNSGGSGLIDLKIPSRRMSNDVRKAAVHPYSPREN